jgi:hypothetical protein
MAQSKGLGGALYLEFRRDNFTHQFMFTPLVVHPDNNEIIPATVISRLISEDHPRRPWKFRVLPHEKAIQVDASTGKLKQIADLKDAVAAIAPGLQNINLYLESTRTAGWVLYKDQPIIVEINNEDAIDLSTAATPSGLMRRLDRARRAAGFADELFDTVSTGSSI